MLIGVPGPIVTTPQRLKRVRPHRSRKRRWTRRVRARIVANLGRYPVISAIVAALLLPGGFVLVPAIAWWHRRRRALRRALQHKTGPSRRRR